MFGGQSVVAISQQNPASSQAIATATTPLGLRQACLGWRQRAFRRRWARQAMLMISGDWPRWRRSEFLADRGVTLVVV